MYVQNYNEGPLLFMWYLYEYFHRYHKCKGKEIIDDELK
jgi:hypothetical protein